MRNLKKLLALVLAMVMACSLMLSASAAAADYDKYGDKASITPEFDVAVRVLTGLDVLKGDEGGFRPSDTLTRAEAAVIVYRVATGDVNDNQTGLYADYGKFSDVKPEDWFAGYVGYCQNAGYIKGTTPTTFTPYEKVTGYQLLAMLLRVVGYGQNEEFVGNSWQVNVAALSEQLGITNTVKEANFASTLNMPARRDVVAELTFKTMTEVPTVTYTPALAYNDKTTTLGQYFNPTLGQKTFGLWKSAVDKVDNWGRPGYYWVKNGSRTSWTADFHPVYSGTSNATTQVAKIAQVADATFTKRVAECDIAHELNLTKSGTIEKAYIDGVQQTNVKTTAVTTDMGGDIGLYDTTSYVGGNGRLLEVYAMGGDTYRLVEINTYLASVVKVTPEYTDANGHKVPAYATLNVYVKSGDRNDSKDRNGVDWVWDDQKTTFNGVLNNASSLDAANRNDTDNNQVEDTKDAANVTLSSIISTELYTTDVQSASAGYVLVTVSKESKDNGKVDSGLNQKTGTAETVKPAQIVSGGVLTRWTVGEGLNPGTTTVGSGTSAITYKDADKFVLNRRTSADQALSVALDDYGNIIGRVNMANYLVIEKIEWKHGVGIGDGYALADVVLANGNKESGIKVSYINDEPANNVGDQPGHPGFIDATGNGVIGDDTGDERAATVSDYYQNNGAYYRHAFAYSVNSDGTYSLDVRTNPQGTAGTGAGCVDHVTNFNYLTTNPNANTVSNPVDNDNVGYWANANAGSNFTVTINRGQATITSDGGYGSSINSYVATDNTVFLVLNSDGYTYTTYVGKNNVPTLRNVNACFVKGGSGYVTLAVISGITVEQSTFLAYVGDDNQVAGTNTNGLGVGYNIYPLGSASSKMVHDPLDLYDTGNKYTVPGIYEFTLNSKDQIMTMSSVLIRDVGDDNVVLDLNENDPAYAGDLTHVATRNSSSDGNNTSANIIRVALGGLSGNSLETKAYSDYGSTSSTDTTAKKPANVSLGAVADFNVTDDTKVIRIVRYNTNGDSINGPTDAAYLVEGTKSDLAYATNQVAIIEFESQGQNNNTRYYAKTVYILDVLKDVQIGQAVKSVSVSDMTLAINGVNIKTGFTSYALDNSSKIDDALAAAKNSTNQIKLSQASINAVNINNIIDLTLGSGSATFYVYTNSSAVPSKNGDLVNGTTAGTSANASLGVGSEIVIDYTSSTGVRSFAVIEIVAG